MKVAISDGSFEVTGDTEGQKEKSEGDEVRRVNGSKCSQCSTVG
jgi:hypothetical protein